MVIPVRFNSSIHSESITFGNTIKRLQRTILRSEIITPISLMVIVPIRDLRENDYIIFWYNITPDITISRSVYIMWSLRDDNLGRRHQRFDKLADIILGSFSWV